MSKLKNLKAIGEILDGTHRTQTRKTFGWSDSSSTAEKNAKHEVGDVWIETNPITGVTYRWEQKDGYRVKTFENLDESVKDIREYLSTFPNCPREVCTCKSPMPLDKKFRNILGMCHDCVVEMETKLKINGKFNEYAIDKMKRNAESFFKQSDQEVEQLKKELSNPINFVEGVDGRTETWTSENPQFLIDQIDEQYNQYKSKIKEKLNAEI